MIRIDGGDRIAEVAYEVLSHRHEGWSDEALLFHPTEAHALCDEVRRRMRKKAEVLPDEHVLRAMVNARKRGRAPDGSKLKARAS